MSTDHDRYDQQYVATHAAVQVAPVTLDDERPRYEALLHDREDFWDETVDGGSARAWAGGTDFRRARRVDQIDRPKRLGPNLPAC